MVSTEDTVFPLTEYDGWLNEQIGGIVTNGVIERQARVTVPEYPSSGLMLIVPCAALPAGTVLGATAVATVTVN